MSVASVNILSSLGQRLLNLFFPKECVACGRALPAENGDHLCPGCLRQVDWVEPPVCRRCGRPFPGHIDCPQECFVCRLRPPEFNRARSALVFRDAGQKFILKLKYNQGTFLIPPAVRWLKAAGEKYYRFEEFDVIVPVPLHPRKARERGFNQSQLLAEGLGKVTGVPVARRSLIRPRYTRTQTRLPPKERQRNVRGAFLVKDRDCFRDINILLVDDVFTTGSTVTECARVLKKAGAVRVDVLTLARAL